MEPIIPIMIALAILFAVNIYLVIREYEARTKQVPAMTILNQIYLEHGKDCNLEEVLQKYLRREENRNEVMTLHDAAELIFLCQVNCTKV